MEIDDVTLFRISELVGRESGIVLGPQNRDLVSARLTPRIAKLGLQSFRAYLDAVHADTTGGELRCLLDAVATNLTRFMREAEHFDFMCDTLVPRLTVGGPDHQRSLRVWVAGCSSGEEAYSIGISLAERLPNLAGSDVRILATDLCRDALTLARRARYQREQVDKLDRARVARFFRPVVGGDGTQLEVAPAIRRLVTFARLNLVESWPMRAGFDVIFCRNVMIYFSKETCRNLATRFGRQLRPGGLLFIGHSESLDGYDSSLEKVSSATYRRREDSPSTQPRRKAG